MGLLLICSIASVFLAPGIFFVANAQECAPAEEVFCALPEVADAASTGAISLKAFNLVQGYDEVCKGSSSGEYRTADGTCNNIFNLGAANRPPRRLLPNAYDDHVNAPRSLDSEGFPLPAATNVSRTVHPDEIAFQGFTVMLMQWGQFMDHDLTGFPISSEVDRTIRCCGENGEALPFRPDQECLPILLTPEDQNSRFNGACMEFARSVAARDATGKKTIPREQVNSVTSFIDASTVYGSSQELQNELREYTPFGPGFLLRTSFNDLLPATEEENCIHRPFEFCFLAGKIPGFLKQKLTVRVSLIPSSRAFLTGDSRVNEQPGLIVMHTLWVRIHNQIARELRLLRPNDTPEGIFQVTRKIVAAIIQHITYDEWLPLIIGRARARDFGLLPGVNPVVRSSYTPSVDPRITNVFSTVAMRFGHSLIPQFLNISGNAIPLRQLFNRPDVVFDNFNNVLLSLVRPLRTNGAMKLDRHFTEEVTGHLFEPDDQVDGAPSRGLDLVALNIQRGRDHGIPPYNHIRKFCGLDALQSFDDLPADVADVMRQVYRSVDDIDAFSGIMSEPRTTGLVGESLACLLGNQFHALKFGDRFYYETERMPEGFTNDQLTAIRSITLARVCCQVKGVLQVQEKGFLVPGPKCSTWSRPCFQEPPGEVLQTPGKLSGSDALARTTFGPECGPVPDIRFCILKKLSCDAGDVLVLNGGLSSCRKLVWRGGQP
ncbi:hypothetical protein BaRGS_00024611, partial [Batillaria attramentaria]